MQSDFGSHFTLVFALFLALFLVPSCGGGGDDGGPGSGPAGPTLPATGLTLCSDATGSVIDCTGTGQDGEFITNPMSFTANGNGTVTDNVTGLVWQQADDDAFKTWATAESYCSGLSLGGHADWRLPAIGEFTNIVDFGTHDPSVNAAAFPGVTGDPYWSATTYASNTTVAWYAYFLYGDSLTGAKTNTSLALCVRGAAPASPSFSDNGDGTVTDGTTHLMWQQQDDNTTRNWADALTYCNGLSLAGHDDWRLPNVKELASIADVAATSPAIDAAVFPDTDDYYWTSTSYEFALANAWRVDFIEGAVNAFGKSSSLYVRCVR